MGVDREPVASTSGCPEEAHQAGPLSGERLAEIARSLGHPARVQIVCQFDHGEERTVTEIVSELELAQSTVSEHLRILREAGVLGARRDGAWIWYCLCSDTLTRFADAVQHLAAVPQDAGAG